MKQPVKSKKTTSGSYENPKSITVQKQKKIAYKVPVGGKANMKGKVKK